MFDELKEKIKDKKLILFGEIHGTKETPQLLSDFFSELAKEEDFDVFFEIPEEYKDNIKDFFLNNNINDGRNSLEYFKLIQNLKKLNKKYDRDIKIFCIDISSNTSVNKDKKKVQYIREKIMAENILKSFRGKKTFVILGSIHASKHQILLPEIKIIPTGSILFDKLNDSIFSINILPKSGEFYNLGVKKIEHDNGESFNKNFDYIYNIGKITPCSFLIK